MSHPYTTDEEHTSNDSSNLSFCDIAAVHLTRRSFLHSCIATAAASLFNTYGYAASPAALPPSAAATSPLSTLPSLQPGLGFTGIAASTSDSVVVPDGYTAQVLFAWGDPVGKAGYMPTFKHDASNSSLEQSAQAGMHHDGMHFFPFAANPSKRTEASSTHGLLAINHEYVDQHLLYTDGMQSWSAEKVKKSQAAHGVSIIEVRHRSEAPAWEVIRPSHYARRITATTPITLAGPAAGHPLMQTADDPGGRSVLGTMGNCASGQTPWGTYLTCEENWHSYFAASASPTPEQKRYGITTNAKSYRWHEYDPRFNVQLHPNEPHRFGWVVEINPYDPTHQPVKRTALGRFRHESATVTLSNDQRVVVYMGDDERNEYIYKFVSRDAYDAHSPEANVHLLDHGTLYVARFNNDKSGEWLELIFGLNGLIPENGFNSQAEVLIKTRQAADRVGATMMDRPEWIAMHPHTHEVYASLSNNSQRGTLPASINSPDGTTASGSARPAVDAANPRANNLFGHIIRWREKENNPASHTFSWDVFIQGGDPSLGDINHQGTLKGDLFGSPDGLWFDKHGRLWVQTDVGANVMNQDHYRAIGNNQIIAIDVITGEGRRFLTGPTGCEMTGLTATPDGKTMFVNIQHPGEPAKGHNDPAFPKANSTWPDGEAGGRPRSATLVITRNDGGEIGT